MSDVSIAVELQRFVGAVEAASGFRPVVRPGATLDQIEAAEAELGVTFGPQLRELYLASNGGIDNCMLSYSLVDCLGEPTGFFRAEMSMGQLESDRRVRELMDPTRLVAMYAWVGAEWIVSPDDPQEIVYGNIVATSSFGVVGRGWRRLVSMHADLAERGFVKVAGADTARPDIRWWGTGDGGTRGKAIHEPEVLAAILAEYEIDLVL